MKNSTQLQPLSRQNLAHITQAAQSIFPAERETLATYYHHVLTHGTGEEIVGWTQSYLGLHHGKVAGVSGLYRLKAAEEDLWLDWFGVVPTMRGKAMGQALLQCTIEKARILGAPTLRLWTTGYMLAENPLQAFYENFGFINEKYHHKRDGHAIHLFSKSLNDTPVDLWYGAAKMRPEKIF